MVKELTQRMSDNTIKIPSWLMPVIMGIGIVISGAAFKGLASEEAKELDEAHVGTVTNRVEKVEEQVRTNDHRLVVIEVNVEHLTNTVEETNETVNSMSKIVNKIANKLDIDD